MPVATIATAGAPISVEHVSHGYRELAVLDDVSLHVAEGERLAVVGPSGCGKSTLLHLIAGLEQPASGTISVAGRDDPGARLAGCALMPQDDLLLPWRSALDNAALALVNAGVGRAQAREAALPLFRRFGLAGFEHEQPRRLSGGMRQRVAFLRTLLAGKGALLLDEPFASLDALTREELGGWLAEALEGEPRTAVLVTHDVDEALRTCGRIAVLSPRPARVVLSAETAGLTREDVMEVLRR
jgi:ABC-type nitrate/sulfonate/bicarbonate transport system ATPase subunit